MKMSLADWAKNDWLRRNETQYDLAGNVSEDEAQELIDFCNELKIEVLAWLKKNHKGLK